MLGEAQDGGARGTNPMLELSLPKSPGMEGGTTPQSGQSLCILNHHPRRNPLSSRLRDVSSQLPSLWCLTWQELHDSMEITPAHGKSNPSLSRQLRLLQRKAGETQEQSQSQRNLSQKGHSTEIFILPRHLEADGCTQTQHFTSAHPLI